MRRHPSLVVLVTALLLPAGGAPAHESKVGALRIVHPWVVEQSDPAASPAVISMTIHNSGRKADRLLSAASPLAASAEVRPGADPALAVAPIDVPASGKAVLKSSGPHVRLVGLARRLSAYDTVPLTLNFERAGKIDLEVMVEERH